MADSRDQLIAQLERDLHEQKVANLAERAKRIDAEEMKVAYRNALIRELKKSAARPPT